MHHPNSVMQSLTRSIFDIKDGSDSTVKYNLDEIEKIIEKSMSCSKRDSATKKKEETGKVKEVRVAGSFLNRKSSSTKSVSNKTSEKEEKKITILPEPDSQVNNVYYVIMLHIFLQFFTIFSNIPKFVFRIMYI